MSETLIAPHSQLPFAHFHPNLINNSTTVKPEQWKQTANGRGRIQHISAQRDGIITYHVAN